VTVRELGPTQEEVDEMMKNRFEWGDGWVKITDDEGVVRRFEGPLWHRAYITVNHEELILIESCRPHRKSGIYEPWLVMKEDLQGKHTKIGKSQNQKLLQCRLKMATCNHRDPSRKFETTVGPITKAHGWPATVCIAGICLSYDVSLV